MDHIVGRIQSVWLQPYLQRKVEGFVENLGQRTMKMIQSLYEDPSEMEGIHKHREEGADDADENEEKKSKIN